MIGSRSIGTRWVGSGRSQRADYVQLSADFEAGADLSADLAAGKALSADFVAGMDLSGTSQRLRGMRCDFEASQELAGSGARIRPMAANLVAGIDLEAATARVRPMSADMSHSAAMTAGAGRLRKIGASFEHGDSMTARVGRFRQLAASMSASIGLAVGLLRGRAMSGAFSSAIGLVATQIRDFFNPAHAGRRIVVQEKDRAVEVIDKDRVIVFAGDDEALFMQEKVKQPREIVDYEIDMRRYFRSIPDDFIVDVQLEVDVQGDPDDLEIGPGDQPNWVPVGDPIHRAKVWTGGGRDGITYKVTALVTTNRGRVEEVDFLIIVEEQ